MKKKGLLLILVALVCLLFALPNNKEANAADEQTATLSFSNTGNRKSIDTTRQVWEQNGIIFINNKASSSNDVADYSNPIRLYKDSSITISMADSNAKITAINFNSNGTSSYKTNLSTSLANYNPSVSGNNYKITLDSVEEFTLAISGGQVRLVDITVTYVIVNDGPVLEPNFAALKQDLQYYYNYGSYRKDTIININVNSDDVKDEIENLVHAYKAWGSIAKQKTTTYSVDYLYFESGRGYGTSADGNNLTSGSYNAEKGIFESTTTHNLPGMEEYYCTLNDFIEGSHTSAHNGKDEEGNNKTLVLSENWTKDENGVYSNSSQQVISAFVLFTAPTWLDLGKEYNNFMDYTKATVQINEDGHLEMKLWVSYDNKEGLLDATAEEEDQVHAVFSQATIYDPKTEEADNAVEYLNNLTEEERTIDKTTKLPTEIIGSDAEISWEGTGVANNILTYSGSATKTEVTLTATITIGKQVREVPVVWYHDALQEETGVEVKANYDFVTNFNTYAASWTNTYKKQTITSAALGADLPAATITLSNANKQAANAAIPDRPVLASKGSNQYVTIEIQEGRISEVTFNFMQWKTVTFNKIYIEYYDGVQWVTCSTIITSPSSGSLSSNIEIPASASVTQVRLVVYTSNTSNKQLGLNGINLTIIK